MSLLMEALKQAEHAKRDQPAAPSDPQPPLEAVAAARAELSLAPAETPTPSTPVEAFSTGRQAEELVPPQEVQPEAAHQTPAPPPSATPVTAPGAPAAARILAAGTTRHAAGRWRNRFGLAGLAGVLSLAIGGYYYYAALTQPQPYMNLPMAATPLDTEPLPAAEALDSTPTFPEEPVAAPTVAPEMAEAPAPAQTPWREGSPPAAAVDAWQPAPVDPRVVRGERYDATAEVPATAAAPTPVIRIRRGSSPDPLSNALVEAYAAFRAGDWTRAEQAYRGVLAREPGNRDAHLGLAALAVRAGSPDAARAHYRELLRRNPKDAVAYAALVELDANRSADSESELKLRLAELPQSAALRFALANLYAGQQRWPLAQQAYFEAQQLAPDDPDYAFNLAVSLEHLGQQRLAVDYYRRALRLAEARATQFDPDAARHRIALLTAATPP